MAESGCILSSTLAGAAMAKIINRHVVILVLKIVLIVVYLFDQDNRKYIDPDAAQSLHIDAIINIKAQDGKARHICNLQESPHSISYKEYTFHSMFPCIRLIISDKACNNLLALHRCPSFVEDRQTTPRFDCCHQFYWYLIIISLVILHFSASNVLPVVSRRFLLHS